MPQIDYHPVRQIAEDKPGDTEDGGDLDSQVSERRGRSFAASQNWHKIILLVSLVLSTVLALLFVLARRVPQDPNDALVRTANGTYAGRHLPDLNQHVFLGIPFAAPPLGPLRFRHPQPFVGSWEGVRNATEYAPNCPRFGVRDPEYPRCHDRY
jgi:hypothetical protein